MSGTILSVSMVPGLPHVLSPETGPKWEPLHKSYQELGRQIEADNPDVLVFYSTQWLSVLGTSFQSHPNPKGTHVDENWYEWGELEFDFKVDGSLSESFASVVRENGLPTKTVNFDAFPVDTGTLVAMQFLNPSGKIPVSIVSSWVYADGATTQKLGSIMKEVALKEQRRVAFVAISQMSSRYFTEDILPKDDHVSRAEDDGWNRRLLSFLEAGDKKSVEEMLPTYIKEATPDMQFKAFDWIRGILGEQDYRAQILAYGPLWGTGAVVAQFREDT